MGKSRDLYKKTGDTKGIFHTRMGIIKDKNSKDLTEAEEIKKMWQEYTEELFKRDLNDVDNYTGVVTHLECEVKWALGSMTMNKPSGGNGIPVELFQILKDETVKVLHSICQQVWETQQWPQDRMDTQRPFREQYWAACYPPHLVSPSCHCFLDSRKRTKGCEAGL